jgi:hypothetical protein
MSNDIDDDDIDDEELSEDDYAAYPDDAVDILNTISTLRGLSGDEYAALRLSAYDAALRFLDFPRGDGNFCTYRQLAQYITAWLDGFQCCNANIPDPAAKKLHQIIRIRRK